ncbi:glycosyltransferase 87 family protein [Microterricola viridarii]|nr:glycosyltransferase 87 family protein [Microterricola viridarii]
MPEPSAPLAGAPVATRPAWPSAGVLRHPLTLWAAFALVHTVLVLLCLHAPGWPLGDVEVVYKFWVAQAVAGGNQVGIDEAWVYPILAYLPMALANLLGPGLYVQTWLGLVVALNAAAFAVLIGGLRRRPARPRWRVTAAWWWLGFLLLLGPIALARIDAVTIPLAIVGLLLAAGRPVLGVALLTVAAWVKVWPAALVGALFVAARARARVWQSALVVSGIVVLVSVVLGGGAYVLGFVGEQTGRGLQIEAPIATPWLWQTAAGVPGVGIYYDFDILTYQLHGAGTGWASALATPLMAVAAAAVLLLAVLRHRAGAHYTRLVPPLALALVLVFIVFNKVGSPQFMTWLAAPVILGLVYRGRQWRLPAALALTLAALTQLIYPYLYGALLAAEPWMVFVITLRNLLELVLLGWAVRAVFLSNRGPLLRTIP